MSSHGNLKGQSAIEYLSTYGWMLLVVSVAGTSIFGVVQDQGQTTSSSDLANADIQIDDIGVNSNGELQFVLRAATSEQINLKKVNLTDKENSSKTTTQNSNIAISPASTETISLKNVERSENSNKFDITFTYDLAGLADLTTTGSITAPVKIVNTVQNAVGDLLASGDSIDKINVDASVRSNSTNPVCLGEHCNITTASEMSGTEKYVNRSGDEMTGTLETNKLNTSCIGNNCNISTGTLDGYVNSDNNTMDGTLNTTEVKPINAPMCAGENC